MIFYKKQKNVKDQSFFLLVFFSEHETCLTFPSAYSGRFVFQRQIKIGAPLLSHVVISAMCFIIAKKHISKLLRMGVLYKYRKK